MTTRYWSLSGILPKRTVQRLLIKHHLMDSIVANILHDGHGVSHGPVARPTLLIPV